MTERGAAHGCISHKLENYLYNSMAYRKDDADVMANVLPERAIRGEEYAI